MSVSINTRVAGMACAAAVALGVSLSGTEASAAERVNVPTLSTRDDFKGRCDHLPIGTYRHCDNGTESTAMLDVRQGATPLSETNLQRPPSAAAQRGAATQARYQCINRDNTPLWYNGAILGWANEGQGLYDVMDFGGQRIWARLWGGGDVAYQLDRWNVGWCG